MIIESSFIKSTQQNNVKEYHDLLNWLNERIMKPDSDLGRNGAVCPFNGHIIGTIC